MTRKPATVKVDHVGEVSWEGKFGLKKRASSKKRAFLDGRKRCDRVWHYILRLDLRLPAL